jgi:hypothetical protein
MSLFSTTSFELSEMILPWYRSPFTISIWSAWISGDTDKVAMATIPIRPGNTLGRIHSLSV